MRRVLLVVLLSAAVLNPISARAEEGSIDVIRVEGYLDDRTADFVEETINGLVGESRLAVLQFDAKATLGDGGRIAAIMASPPLPLVSWVAPGARVPTAEMLSIIESAQLVYGPPPLAADAEAPGLRGLLLIAHGQAVVVADGSTTLIDVVASSPDEPDLLVPSGDVVFHDPSLFDRFLRAAVSPAAAMFYLVGAMAVAAFEFYAAGVGVAAAVSVVLFFLAGYGMSVLPVRPWAVALIVGATLAFLVDFQHMRPTWRSVVGTVGFFVGGLFLVVEKPGLDMAWWSVVLSFVALISWVIFAMTTVVRARFSTPTIGREHLVGRNAIAVTEFDPNGEVQIDGARWRATSARAAALSPGDPVLITRVVGVVLEVDPAD